MWILPFVLWVAFFYGFWNVKRWTWHIAKIAGAALLCALASAAAVAVAGFAFIHIFD
jgi:hypothetical protein